MENEENVPYFDRFDICAAHLALEADYNKGGVLWERPSNKRNRRSTAVQLHRMNYRVGPFYILSENAQAIYNELEVRYGLVQARYDAWELQTKLTEGES